METSLDLGTIEDVDASTKEFIRRRWGKKFYIIGGILIGLAILVFPIAGFFVFLAIMWFSIGWSIARKLVHLEFMRQFAEKNGFSYEAGGALESVTGDLFGRGHSRQIIGVASGIRAGLPLRFFLYTYTIGSGKHRQTECFTVAEVTFDGSVPSLILDNKDDWRIEGNPIGGKYRTISTGNSFDDRFILRIAEGHEIEALEVLTPEVMEEIVERGRDRSFEFVGHKLYVWKEGYAKTTAEIQAMLSLAQYLIDALALRLSRLHDDVEAVIGARRRDP
jgi:hypothetical protein